MILTEKIKIKISRGNKGIYQKKFKKEFEIGKIIEISPNDLSKTSQQKIEVKCDICEKNITTTYHSYMRNYEKYNLYTCKKCSKIKGEKTCIEKYGVNNYGKTEESINKQKKTFLEKYGVDNPLKNKDIKDKIIKTNKKKYGVSYGLQNSKIKEKSKKTLINNYGVDNYSKSADWLEKVKITSLKKWNVDSFSKTKECKEKTIRTNLKKYNYEYHNKNPERKEDFSKSVKKGIMNSYKMNNFIENNNIIDVDDENYKLFCDVCNENYLIKKSLFKNRLKAKTTLCVNCNPNNSNKSGKEVQLLNFLDDFNIEIIRNSRKIIPPLELDFYLPYYNLAIEFNSLYWHNELNKSNNYHLEKTEMCESKNIQLIHIWEDDWDYKKEIIKSIISNKLGKNKRLFARKCEVKEVKDTKLIRNFLDVNHIQGYVASKVKIGLYYENELVSLMTFGKKRKTQNSFSKDGEWEMLRFCNKLNYNIVGGASRIFKYFLRKYNPKEIVTYADRSYSMGKLYDKLGFKFIHKTSPNYHYIVDNIRKYRFGFRKDVLVREGYNKNKSEHQIMLERGIYRIYNSGNLKYIYHL